MKRSVMYVVAGVDRAVAFEWVADRLDRERFDLSFVLLNPGDSALERFLRERGVPVERVTYRGYRDLPRAFREILALFRARRPDVLHAHLLPALMASLPAAWLAGVSRRVHTRHHSTFHHDFARKWVYVDRALNALSTRIVAISPNVEYILREMERVPRAKIRTIPHGFQAEDFTAVGPERVAALRERYRLDGPGPVVGVIARYILWKGIGDVVAAAHRLLRTHPDAVFVFANARGDQRVRDVVRTLPEANRREIEFEPDLFALYRLFDVYVHTPIDERIEAYGQTYVEALLSSVPSVFTLSGIASAYIEHERNALVVPYRKPAAIARAVERLLSDEALADRLTRTGLEDATRLFGVDGMIAALERVYAE